jgi:hypothetical protein
MDAQALPEKLTSGLEAHLDGRTWVVGRRLVNDIYVH